LERTASLLFFLVVSAVATAQHAPPVQAPSDADVERAIGAGPTTFDESRDKLSRGFLATMDKALSQIDTYAGDWRPDVSRRMGTGPESAPVLVVAYGDSTNDTSRRRLFSLRRLREEQATTVRLVHKQFPGSGAMELARYVETAAVRDPRKAYGFFLRLHAEQSAGVLAEPQVDALATEIGVEHAGHDDAAWKAGAQRLDADIQEAINLRIGPDGGVWIHGATLDGAPSFWQLHFLVAYAERRLRAGTPLGDKVRNATSYGSLAALADEIGTDGEWPHERVDLVYRKALRFDPRHVTNLCNYGSYLARNGRHDAADVLLRRAIALDPGNAMAMERYAGFLLQQRSDAAAAKQWRRAVVQAAGPHPRILTSYAQALGDSRADRPAVEVAFQRAMSADPDYAQAPIRYATYLARERADPDRVLALLRRALASDPARTETLSAAAEFLAMHGDLDQAEALHRRATRSTARATMHLHLRSYARFLDAYRAAPQRADTLWLEAIARYPDDADFTLQFARFLEEHRRDYDRAETFYRAGIATEPKNRWGLARLAVLLALRKGNLPQADIYFRRAIHLKADSPTTLANHAQALYLWGRKEEARKNADLAMMLRDLSDVGKLELLFYRAAHEPSAWPAVLQDIASSLERGVRSKGWPLQANADRAEADRHPSPQLIRQLARVISAQAALETLREFPEWPSARP